MQAKGIFFLSKEQLHDRMADNRKTFNPLFAVFRLKMKKLHHQSAADKGMRFIFISRVIVVEESFHISFKELDLENILMM